MGAVILRLLSWAVYVGGLAVLFVVVAYLGFNAFVRSGVTAVPDLIGVELSEARARLADRGLVASESGPGQFDDEVPVGHVLRQEPSPASVAKRRGVVRLIVSRGPQQVTVPDLTGRELHAAQMTLAAEGLAVGRVARVFASRGRAGEIVAQDPAAGSLTGRGQSIDLFILLENRAATWIMPDLAYLDYETVRRVFEARGFRFGSIKYEPYEGTAPGTVLRQYPLAGHPVEARDAISLVVAARGDQGGALP